MLPAQEVYDYVDTLMAEGKAGPDKGWSMATIVDQTKDHFYGSDGVANTARQYILEKIVGISDEAAFVEQRQAEARKEALFEAVWSNGTDSLPATSGD